MELICRETKRRSRVEFDPDRAGVEVCVGRRREWAIVDSRVSRCHCRVRACDSAAVEVTSDVKPIYIRRRNAKRVAMKEPGTQTRLKCGDALFLLREGDELLYGFDLKKSDAPLTPQKAAAKGQGMFSGMEFVFLTKSHIGPLKRKVLEHGGEVVDEIGAQTDYVIVSEEDKRQFEAVSKEACDHVQFVKREFVSDCLIAGRVVDDRPYWAYPHDPTPNHLNEQTPEVLPAPRRTQIQTAPKEGGGVSVELPSDYAWIEAYDSVKACETVAKLFRHWTHYTMSLDVADSMVPSEDAQPNVVCPHVACSALEVCYVHHLSLIKSHYHGGSTDAFKIKAINRAIRVLESLRVPLTTVHQIEGLKLGKKTTDKLVQILNTGRIQRNEELAGDAQEQIFDRLTKVWGAGQSAVQKWIAAGCTTLEDVARRRDLTTIQRVGLKYFDDFEQKIPRAEAIQIFETVRDCVLRTLARLMHTTVRRIQPETFCSALGSFVRGKEEMGDMDFLIAPPSSCSELSATEILQEILKALLLQRIITSDLHPEKLSQDKERTASWMGVCVSPSSQFKRRIDIKVYCHEDLPFALNYFIGSQDFVRALRYWCNTPTEETKQYAHRFHPEANAFQLSDHGLFPIARPNFRRKASDVVPLGPSVPCTSESDIFRAVGLDYVPPWMRIFSENTLKQQAP